MPDHIGLIYGRIVFLDISYLFLICPAHPSFGLYIPTPLPITSEVKAKIMYHTG